MTVYDLVLRRGQAGTTKGVVPIDVGTGAKQIVCRDLPPRTGKMQLRPLSRSMKPTGIPNPEFDATRNFGAQLG